MNSFFELVFSDKVLSQTGNTQVCCPFPHTDNNGNTYYETRPSAGVNIDKGLFHCFSCNASYNEIGFIASYMDLSRADAYKFKQILTHQEDISDWSVTGHEQLFQKPDVLKKIEELQINKKTIKELYIGSVRAGEIDFPVSIFSKLVDVVSYRPGQTPKVLKRKGSPSGMIIPYDIWRNTTKPTVICAGEKDMAIARSHDINAITITGGERTLPHFFKHNFKDRTIYIVYDNDSTGREGAEALAIFLSPVVKKLKIIDISPVCTLEHEDLWDFFVKYKQTKEDLNQIINNTPEFEDQDFQAAKEKQLPTMHLMEAGKPDNATKILRSNIQVISIVEEQFLVPSSVVAIKKEATSDATRNTMNIGTTRAWYLEPYNIKDMLYLIDSKLKEHQIYEHLRQLLRIPKKEDGIEMSIDTKEIVYKCSVADLTQPDENTQRIEFQAYTLNHRLENGKKYLITYKLVTHPFDGQKLVMIILDIENSNDSVNNYNMTSQHMKMLKEMKPTTNLLEHINDNIARVKGMVNANYDEKMVLLIDLWFHSALKFKINTREEWGILDVLLVGESRTGKSSTAETLQKYYNVGEIIPMPNTTKAGLIGGSNKSSSGTYQTRIGKLPMNHTGAVILEELLKAREQNVIKELTEIKSSKIARITRVNGSIEVPCAVRILTITNAKTIGDVPKPISSYPNGIAVVTDLIGAAEDIARFDISAVFSFMANEDIDPFAEYKQPYSLQHYQNKINWAWSRKAENIKINKDIYTYLIQTSNHIKSKFDSHIKIFGTETWKKIIRIAIATAIYTISTDDTFENIIITKEHIDFAANFLVSLYDNPVFRFKEYVEEEKRMKEIDKDGIAALENFYRTNPTLIIHLENVSETSRNNMAAISGMSNDEFSRYINGLVSANFITFHGHAVHPTERFRRGMRLIDRKNMVIKPLGRLVKKDVKDDVV